MAARSSTRSAGLWWIAAAALFWLAWLLMPGVGITDADRILTLVAQHRGAVRLSAALQLLSAACYAPALVGLLVSPRFGSRTGVRVGSGLLLVGAMGSAADAIFHLLADAMLAPGVDRPSLVAVMRQMQGPGLRFILPLIAAYFAGAACLSVALWRAGLVSHWNPLLYPTAIGVAVAGGFLLAGHPAALRGVGLAMLGGVAAAQVWLGVRLCGAASADLRARREAIVVRHMQAENIHDFDTVIASFGHPRYELIATDLVHDGESAVREYFRETRTAFPDQRNELISLRHADDAVIVELWLLGTQRGPLLGSAPTGKSFRCRMTALFLFEGAELVCERVYFDSATILRQLGA